MYHDNARKILVSRMKRKGHRPTNVQGDAARATAECALCPETGTAEREESDAEWKDYDVETAGAATERCTGEFADSAHEYVDAIGGVQSWHEAQRALDLKHGGRDSLKLGNNVYLKRRPRAGEPDLFAVRLHSIDVVTYRPDSSVEIRTGGWFSKITRRMIEGYTNLTVWTDGPLYHLNDRDPDPRWFVLRPTAPVRNGWSEGVRPHHYVRFDRPLRIYPHGGVQRLSDSPTCVHYKLERTTRGTGRRGVRVA